MKMNQTTSALIFPALFIAFIFFTSSNALAKSVNKNRINIPNGAVVGDVTSNSAII